MSLTGRTFDTVKTESFPSVKEALAAVTAYAQAAGYTNVKIVDNSDFDSIRFTARTPGGRSGRNVAFGDYDHNQYCDDPWCGF